VYAFGQRRDVIDPLAKLRHIDLGTLDAVSRARHPSDIIDATLGCMAAHGLRSAWGELRGDAVVMLAMSVPDDDAVRIEEVLGLPVAAMRFPVAAYGSFSTVVQQRRSILEEAFPSRMISMFHHLSEDAKAAARHHLGEGPLVVVPIEDGDTLLGILLGWGPTVAQERSLIETLGRVAGVAWHLVEDRPEQAFAPAAGVAMAPAELATSIREIIAPGGIRSALQPLVHLSDRTVRGYEALCRFSGTGGIRNPDDLFAAAATTGLKREVDAACLDAAFAAAVQASPATLFVNVAVETLVEGHSGDRLSKLAEASGVSPSAVVLEVSERTPVSDLARLRRVVADLRKRGFRIAIDDAGAGHASMLVIAEVEPEFVKIDRLLIHGVDVSAARRALVVSLLSFGAHINVRIIAEGIETEEELQALLSLGVEFGQGWHLGRPVMVEPPAGAANVVPVAPDWFSKQRSIAFQTGPGATAPASARGSEPPARISRRARVALPRALINAATAVQSEHDPSTILEVMAAQLQTVMPVDAVYIYAADESQNRFVPVYATGKDAAARMAYSYSMDLGVNGRAFKLGVPQNICNTNADPELLTIPGIPCGIADSLLVIPLIAGDRRLGVLNCGRVGVDRFSAADLEAAALFGHTAAASWRNAELYRELGERATTDPLTGLLNSRWLRDVGEREVAQSRRSGQPMAVLLLDLDKFKQINDAGGHSAGDLVLRRVAAALRGSIRAGDAAVRLGGEEFLVVLRDSDAVGASRMADAFRSRLAAVQLPQSCMPRGPLTVSAGIAVLPDNGSVLTDLVRAADVAMYKAKRAGGDRHKLCERGPDARPAKRSNPAVRGAA
jgi:diguanylate cyclase (GGDEF)-like protein